MEDVAERIKELNGITRVISHFDSDGITSASIMLRLLQELGKEFWLSTMKQMDEQCIEELRGEQEQGKFENIIFLDFSYNEKMKELKNVLIVDHHESNKIEIPCVHHSGEEISSAGLAYLLWKKIFGKNKEMARLAVIGMIGDLLEKNISALSREILQDSEIEIKKGLLLFSCTRPLSRALEFSSSFFIPGVTGNAYGVRRLLQELSIDREKTMLDLSEDEIDRLITYISIRKKDVCIGNLYLLKFFSKIEDVREISAMVNGCSRMGRSDLAISFLLGCENAIKKAERIYNSYKHEIINALNFFWQNKEEGNGFVLINAKNNIKDTIIGTTVSIISNSSFYAEETIFIGMAYQNDRIKISLRTKKANINMKGLAEKICKITGGNYGGHEKAAGALIKKENENIFIELIKREIEMNAISVKVK